MLYEDFYSEMGKLLYGVADIDKVITPEEKQTLQRIIQRELLPREKHKDRFGTNAAYYAEIEFDYLDDAIADAETAFESFLNFVEDHHTAFTQKMKWLCVYVAAEIADAYRHTNKKEKQLILRMQRRLNKILLMDRKDAVLQEVKRLRPRGLRNNYE